MSASCFSGPDTSALTNAVVLEAHFVYGLYQAGRLLYIGKTNSPHHRLKQHRTLGHPRVRALFAAGHVTMRILSVWLNDEDAWAAEQALIGRHYGGLVNSTPAQTRYRKPKKEKKPKAPKKKPKAEKRSKRLAEYYRKLTQKNARIKARLESLRSRG
jgi:predicted GIY-YIG superfamily endonuclease